MSEPFGGSRFCGVEVQSPAQFTKSNVPKLHAWLLDLFGTNFEIDRFVSMRNHALEEAGVGISVSMSIWNGDTEFVISARTPYPGELRRGKKSSGGYLGAGMVNRAPYAGEQHRRGRDLHDGHFNEETWRGILHDILLYSLVPLWSHERALGKKINARRFYGKPKRRVRRNADASNKGTSGENNGSLRGNGRHAFATKFEASGRATKHALDKRRKKASASKSK